MLSITNDSPTVVDIYLIYYEWFPYYCWDLSYLLRMIPYYCRVEIYLIYYEWLPYYCCDLSCLLRMIPLLMFRFIWSITNDYPTTVEIYLMYYECSPNTVKIYLIYYEWFPYYCRDLSYLLRMIPFLLLRFILSITNESPTTVDIYLIYYEWFPY